MLLQESRVVWQSSDLPIAWQRARCIALIHVRGAKDEYGIDFVWIGFGIWDLRFVGLSDRSN